MLTSLWLFRIDRNEGVVIESRTIHSCLFSKEASIRFPQKKSVRFRPRVIVRRVDRLRSDP
jgi:hypothetical protein